MVKGQTPRGERRHDVSVFFADLSGFTTVSEALEPDEVIEIVNYYLCAMVEEIRSFRGRVERYLGDCTMAIFGVPAVQDGNHAELAIRAGLRIIERVKQINHTLALRLPQPFGVHIGITTGAIVIGEVGLAPDVSVTAMGDTVNLASRLEGLAGLDEILVNNTTYDHTKHLFYFHPLGFRTLKGKSQQVPVYRMAGIREAPLSEDRETSFTGRTTELAQIREVITRGHQKQSLSVITVCGEPGMGKRRIIHEATRTLPLQTRLFSPSQVSDSVLQVEQLPAMVLHTRGTFYNARFPYWPFRELLRSFFALALHEDEAVTHEKVQKRLVELVADADLCELLAGAVLRCQRIADDQAVPSWHSLFSDTFEELLRVQLRQSPVILLLEDLHTVDSASRDYLLYLIRRCGNLPLTLMCTWQSDPEMVSFAARIAQSCATAGGVLLEIALQPLEPHQSHQLVAALLNQSTVPAAIRDVIMQTTDAIDFPITVDDLIQRAEGKPFHLQVWVRWLEEKVTALLGNGALDDRGRWLDLSQEKALREDLPNKVESVVTARLDLLEESKRDLLRVAAIIGHSFRYQLLVQLLAAQHLHLQGTEFTEFEQAQLIRPARQMTEETYEFWHQILQQVLYNQVLRQRRRELHRLVAQFTVQLYSDKDPALARDLGLHCFEAGNYREAVLYLQQAAIEAEAAYDFSGALRFYEQALQAIGKLQVENQGILTTHWEDWTARKLHLLSCRAALLTRGGYSEGRKAYGEVFHLAQQEKNIYYQCRALNALARLDEQRREFTRANEFARRSRNLALDYTKDNLPAEQRVRRVGIEAELELGLIASRQGDQQEAIAHLQQSLELARGANDLLLHVRALHYLGLYYSKNDSADAITALEEAEQLAQEGLQFLDSQNGIQVHNQPEIALTTNQTQILASTDQGIAHLQDSLQLPSATPLTHTELQGELAEIYTTLGAVYERNSEVAKAVKSFQASEALKKELGDSYGLGAVYGGLGRLYLRRWQWPVAIFYFEKDLQMLYRQTDLQPGLLNQTLNHLAEAYWRCGQVQQARQCYQGALSYAAQIQDPREQQQSNGFTHLGLAKLELSLRDSTAASRSYRQAETSFTGTAQAVYLKAVQAQILQYQGEYAPAESLLLEAIPLLERHDRYELALIYLQYGLLKQEQLSSEAGRTLLLRAGQTAGEFGNDELQRQATMLAQQGVEV